MTIDSGAVQQSAPVADRRSFLPWSRSSTFQPRIIPQIDQHPGIIAYVQHLPGRVLLFGGYALLFGWLGGNIFVVALAAATAFAGRYRWHVILLGTLLLLGQHNFWVDTPLVKFVAQQEGVADQIDQLLLFSGTLALVFLFCSSVLLFWHRIAAVALFRRSTLCLIVGFVGLVLVAESPIAGGVPRVLLWSFLMTLLPYFWFLAYALADAGARERPPLWQHLSVFHPFWGSSLTPFGKGPSYLRRFEAKTEQELAVTQLKGVKLVAWTIVLANCLNSFRELIHGYLAVPGIDEAFLQYLAGTPEPRYLVFGSLAAFFVEDLLDMSVWGGLIVSCARMAGFRLLRNTYNPLGATTLAEFWNRYYFYYKELLLDHFFYPAFLRYFRTNRKLRMFFATFAAACVGNLIFHFIRDIRFVVQLGLWKALAGEASHAFYTLLVSIGIALSQLRAGGETGSKGWLRDRALPCAGVVLFFCTLHVFDAPLDREHSIWQRGEFLLYLAGLDTWI